mmetsp:Transcript_60517/g.157244  ORF Transcript_60517/g.157244 Transcript_60517/m.157244 type:complete len:262 (-) Transcript_60517:293-1078(-)
MTSTRSTNAQHKWNSVEKIDTINSRKGTMKRKRRLIRNNRRRRATRIMRMIRALPMLAKEFGPPIATSNANTSTADTRTTTMSNTFHNTPGPEKNSMPSASARMPNSRTNKPTKLVFRISSAADKSCPGCSMRHWRSKPMSIELAKMAIARVSSQSGLWTTRWQKPRQPDILRDLLSRGDTSTSLVCCSNKTRSLRRSSAALCSNLRSVDPLLNSVGCSSVICDSSRPASSGTELDKFRRFRSCCTICSWRSIQASSCFEI